LQRDVTLGEDFAGGLVEPAAVGDDEGAFALLVERDAESVVEDDQAVIEVVVELARLERLDLPHRPGGRRRLGRPAVAWPSDEQREN